MLPQTRNPFGISALRSKLAEWSWKVNLYTKFKKLQERITGKADSKKQLSHSREEQPQGSLTRVPLSCSLNVCASKKERP